MERYLIIKTRDELLRIKIGQILYFEADRNYTKLLLLTEEGKPRELVISKDPLKVLKDSLEKEMGRSEEVKE